MPNEPLPQFVQPMAAASAKEPFDCPDWIFEPKLDGYRAITVIDSTGKAQLWSRNHLPLEPKFPTMQDAINQLKLPELELAQQAGPQMATPAYLLSQSAV